MRTSALAIVSRATHGLRPFIGVRGEDFAHATPLANLPHMVGVNVIDAPQPSFSWRDLIVKMATHMTYGGGGITTNRLNGGGTAPVNGGWGLNPSGLATSISDTALFDPAAEARVPGTYSQATTNANIPNDTAQVVVTIQASASRAITEFGLFDASTAAPQTAVSGSVSLTTQTIIPVASTAGFVTASFAQLDQEVISISALSAGNMTVARGARGSTAATHANAANIVGGEGYSNMFMKGDFGVINLNSGDSIQFTAKVQFIPQ